MQRKEFIDEIFMFFRCNDEELKRAYDLAFTVKDAIDWDKLYRTVINEAESRYLPVPRWFKDKFPRCLKVDAGDYKTADGLKIRCNLTNKLKYDYETYQCNLTIDEIKNKLQQRFQDKFANMQLFDDYKDEWVTV